MARDLGGVGGSAGGDPGRREEQHLLDGGRAGEQHEEPVEPHRHAGVDLGACAGDAVRLRAAARAAGHPVGPADEPFDDTFFRLMLDAVEPRLGLERPTFLTDWPASMAALARLRADDPR